MKNIALFGSSKETKKIKTDILNNHPEVKIIYCMEINEKLPEVQVPDETDEVVIALPCGCGKLLRSILLSLPQRKWNIKYILDDEKGNDISYDKSRKLTVTDFLSHQLNVCQQNLQNEYCGLKVLVFGGGGSIGSEIVRQLVLLGAKQVIVYDSCEYSIFKLGKYFEMQGVCPDRYCLILGSVLNRDKVKRILNQTKPDMVIHAAAYKHVHLMEENIDEAILVNLEGTKNVIDMTVAEKIKDLIFISTDKVVNPTNIMGATKRLSEYYLKQMNAPDTKMNIVRFGNVIKSRGSVIPLWEYQISRNLPLIVTDKRAKRFFISIPEAVSLVLSTKLYHCDKEVFILNMGEPVLINDIAICMIKSKGLVPDKDIKIKYTGLKLGEKLSEELFTKEEWANVDLIQNGDIYRLKDFGEKWDHIKDIFDTLIRAAKEQKSSQILRKNFETLFPSLSQNNLK